MQFLREDSGVAMQAIAKRLGGSLKSGKRVLWLTSGGSNVGLQVEIMNQLRADCPDRLEGLAIMPMDERYGEPGHKDSNTEQLRKAGFDPGAATWVDVLLHDVPFDQTISFYNDVAAAALANASVVIGQFGLGSDGHVAGVLPGSPATEVDASTVAGYEWDDYTRMTLTPTALKSITAAYVPAYGVSKKIALQRLQKNTETLAELPAKLLYEIPEVYVYNDQLENKE